MDVRRVAALADEKKLGEIYTKVTGEADRRGHAGRTAFAGVGALLGAVLGSFFGRSGAAFGGFLGGVLGAFAGERKDQGLPLVPDNIAQVIDVDPA